MIRKIYWIALIPLLLLTACQAELSPVTETPTLEIINIQVTPATAHWMDSVAECSQQIPDFGVYRQILPISELDLGAADLMMRLGQKQESDPFVTLLGTEEIVLVIGEDVSVPSLNLQTINSIFTGNFTGWGQVPEVKESEGDGDQPIRVLSYPPENELRTLFETSFLGSNKIKSGSTVIFTEETLDNLLVQHPNAIGYTLKSKVPQGVRTLSVSGDNPQPGLQYVLAVTQQEPIGKLRELLLCLQNAP